MLCLSLGVLFELPVLPNHGSFRATALAKAIPSPSGEVNRTNKQPHPISRTVKWFPKSVLRVQPAPRSATLCYLCSEEALPSGGSPWDG